MLVRVVRLYRRFASVRAGAVVLGGTCVAVATTGIVLHLVPGGLPGGDYGAWWITNALGAIAIAVPGTIVARSRPHNPTGWLLLALSLAHALTAAGREYALHALVPGSGLPLGIAALWLSGWMWVDFPLTVPLFFLFPDGKTRSHRWSVVLGVALALDVALTVWIATAPGPMLPTSSPPSANPLGWSSLNRLLEPHDHTVLLVAAATAAAGIVSMLARARDVAGVRRSQILLVAGAAAVATAETVHEDWASYAHEEYVGAAVLVLLACAVAVAVLRYGLYDIDLVVSRTLVYGGLSVVLAAAYLAVVALASELTTSRTLGSIPGAVVVAVLFAPLRACLQRAVDRLLFGARDDPYRVMSSLNERLDTAKARDVLPALVATVTELLKLPYAAIELDDGDGKATASAGTPVSTPIELPLEYGGEHLGRLVLAPRSRAAGFSRRELELLAAIAKQVAVAAYSVRVTSDLQRSREQLVATREEERRRLRRDLHDGLGPTLAAMSMQAATARVLLDTDSAAAAELLEQIEHETRSATAEIRRLVLALRPPALDELGLLRALRAQDERFPDLAIDVFADGELPPLPAAVEAAAYRIATEALTNASRHASATRCSIRLTLNGQLELEIRDDGCGIPDHATTGVGLVSMRERAAELGGTCSITCATSGGTIVIARLPSPETD